MNAETFTGLLDFSHLYSTVANAATWAAVLVVLAVVVGAFLRLPTHKAGRHVRRQRANHRPTHIRH